MRGAPQVGFSATVWKISWRSFLLMRLRPHPISCRERQRQYFRNPAPCQRTTVSGVTIRRELIDWTFCVQGTGSNPAIRSHGQIGGNSSRPGSRSRSNLEGIGRPSSEPCGGDGSNFFPRPTSRSGVLRQPLVGVLGSAQGPQAGELAERNKQDVSRKTDSNARMVSPGISLEGKIFAQWGKSLLNRSARVRTALFNSGSPGVS